jgi:hypothetical protein
MIRYSAKLDSELWMRKCQEIFDTIDDMKEFVADERTRLCHFIGDHGSFTKDDVRLERDCDYNYGLCLRNCSKVVVDGSVIGYCGE